MSNVEIIDMLDGLYEGYKGIDLIWVNYSPEGILGRSEDLFTKSGLNMIVRLIDETLGHELERFYLDFSTIAGKTRLTNKVNDIILLHGDWGNNFKASYKQVYSCVLKEGHTVYLNDLFFKKPDKAEALYSDYKKGDDKHEKLDGYLHKYSKKENQLSDLEKLAFAPTHLNCPTCKTDISMGALEIDIPDLTETEKSKNADLKTIRKQLHDNHSICHQLLHHTTIGSEKHTKTVFLSIPIVGTSARYDENDPRLSGQGAIFVFLVLKDETQISKDKLGLLSKKIATICKDIFLSYLHDASMEMVREALRNSVKAAVAGVMSRNGSHNIGSHVIYNVMKDIDSLNVQDNRLLFKYLQQRMDFLAQISTAWIPEWSSSAWLVKEVLRGFLEQAHLLTYIGKSEGLQVRPVDQGTDSSPEASRIMRPITNFIYKIDQDREGNPHKKLVMKVDFGNGKNAEQDHNGNISGNGLESDILVAIPGGSIGYHALYTIFENFIRNSAKHEFAGLPDDYKRNTHLQISLEIKEDNQGRGYIFRIWDNLSYLSFVPPRDKEIDLTTFSDLYKEDRNDPPKGRKKRIIFSCNNKGDLDIPQNGNFRMLRISESEPDVTIKSEECTDLKSILIANTDKFIIVHPFDKSVDGSWREKDIPNFDELIKNENIRFVPESRWDLFLHNLPDDDENKCATLIALLDELWVPLHIRLNGWLGEGLIDDKGNLRKENWGLSELRICAGYLKGEDDVWDVGKHTNIGNTEFKKDGKSTWILSKADSNELDRSFRAIPVSDETENGDKVAYRLGYSFWIPKPREVLIVGLDLNSNLNNRLSRYGIFVEKDLSDRVDYDCEFLLIYGSAIRVFIDNLKANRTFIERLPYRIIVIADPDDPIANELHSEPFRKRMALCSEKDLLVNQSSLEAFLQCTEEEITPVQNLEDFKITVYEKWVDFLKKELRVLQDPIHLLILPTGGEPEGNLDAFRNIIENIETQIRGKLASEEKNIIIQSFNATYGFYDMEHIPRTLPKTISSMREANYDNMAYGFDGTLQSLNEEIADAYEFINHENGERYHNSISYIRHGTLSGELTRLDRERYPAVNELDLYTPPLYQEKLSGAAAYFPLISTLHALDRNSFTFRKVLLRLIENGLLTVSIADERFWDFVCSNEGAFEQLVSCGVYPIERVIQYKAEPVLAHNSRQILSIEEGISKNDVKITPEDPARSLCAIVIHQGILDKNHWPASPYGTVENFIGSVRKNIPFVAITSGRGEPGNLPKSTKFLGFSILENYVLSTPHSKLLFSDVFLRLIRSRT